MTSRKKPAVALWATVVVVVMLLYPISFGPACWISSRLDDGDGQSDVIPIAYMPMTWAMSASVGIAGTLEWYSRLGSQGNWQWIEVDHKWAWIDRY